tara:strand:- start:1240 stop:1578 length:339 start_codon:yes stop_codon:yes gene_type:complete
MGLPLKDTASGIFLTGAALDTDHCDDAIAAATVADITDFTQNTGAGDGSEVAFALVNRIHDAVTAYNAGHATDLSNITTRLVNSASGSDLTKTYTISFTLNAAAADLNVKDE